MAPREFWQGLDDMLSVMRPHSVGGELAARTELDAACLGPNATFPHAGTDQAALERGQNLPGTSA